MNKAESKKADKAASNGLEEVEKILHKLLDGQNDKHRMLILEGALHAVIHSLEHEAPSGLYSTHFILDALNSSLEAAMRKIKDVVNKIKHIERLCEEVRWQVEELPDEVDEI